MTGIADDSILTAALAVLTLHGQQPAVPAFPDEPPAMTVAEARRILDRFHWTQGDVALALGVTLRTMQRWLKEDRGDIPGPLAAALDTWQRHPESQPLALRRRTAR